MKKIVVALAFVALLGGLAFQEHKYHQAQHRLQEMENEWEASSTVATRRARSHRAIESKTPRLSYDGFGDQDILPLRVLSGSNRPRGSLNEEQTRSCEQWKRTLEGMDLNELSRFVSDATSTWRGLEQDDICNLAAMALMTHAETQPEETLRFLAEDEAFAKSRLRSRLIPLVIAKWSLSSPGQAMDWLTGHVDNISRDDRSDMLEPMMTCFADTNPAWCAELLTKIKPSEKFKAIQLAGSHLRVFENGNLYLQEIRRNFPEDASVFERTLDGIALPLADSGCKDAVGWIKGAGLSEEETTRLLQGIGKSDGLERPGEWLDWVADAASMGKGKNVFVRNVVHHWLQRDYPAAIQWLNGLQPGEFRDQVGKAFSDFIEQE